MGRKKRSQKGEFCKRVGKEGGRSVSSALCSLRCDCRWNKEEEKKNCYAVDRRAAAAVSKTVRIFKWMKKENPLFFRFQDRNRIITIPFLVASSSFIGFLFSGVSF